MLMHQPAVLLLLKPSPVPSTARPSLVPRPPASRALRTPWSMRLPSPAATPLRLPKPTHSTRRQLTTLLTPVPTPLPHHQSRAGAELDFALCTLQPILVGDVLPTAAQMPLKPLPVKLPPLLTLVMPLHLTSPLPTPRLMALSTS